MFAGLGDTVIPSPPWIRKSVSALIGTVGEQDCLYSSTQDIEV
jgi:hypothetical protein